MGPLARRHSSSHTQERSGSERPAREESRWRASVPSEKRDVASGRSRACGGLPISDVSSKMYTDRIVCFFCLRMNKRQATRPTRREIHRTQHGVYEVERRGARAGGRRYVTFGRTVEYPSLTLVLCRLLALACITVIYHNSQPKISLQIDANGSHYHCPPPSGSIFEVPASTGGECRTCQIGFSIERALAGDLLHHVQRPPAHQLDRAASIPPIHHICAVSAKHEAHVNRTVFWS